MDQNMSNLREEWRVFCWLGWRSVSIEMKPSGRWLDRRYRQQGIGMGKGSISNCDGQMSAGKVQIEQHCTLNICLAAGSHLCYEAFTSQVKQERARIVSASFYLYSTGAGLNCGQLFGQNCGQCFTKRMLNISLQNLEIWKSNVKSIESCIDNYKRFDNHGEISCGQSKHCPQEGEGLSCGQSETAVGNLMNLWAMIYSMETKYIFT